MLFFLFSVSHADDGLMTKTQTPPKGIVLIAGMGQSNMFGAAPIPINYKQNLDRRIWMYDLNGWSVAHESVHQWLGAQIGPMLFMARRLLEHDPSLTIGLIPCGTPGVIRDWLPGSAPVYGTSESSYGRCLRLIREASNFGKLGGVLTYQGEADTSRNNANKGYLPAAGAAWKKYYQRVIISLRKDLRMPNLPAIHAQLAKVYCKPATDYPDWDAVKNVQAKVTLPFSAWIRTDDIPLDPSVDCIHHTIAGYQEVGKRFADTWWKLSGGGRL